MNDNNTAPYEASPQVQRRYFYQRLRFWGWFLQLLLIAWVAFAVIALLPPASILFGAVFLMTLPLLLTLPGMIKGSLAGSFWGAVVAMFYVAISVMEIYASPAAGVFPWITTLLATLVFVLAAINIAGFKMKKADYKKIIEENK
jgi:uncharacterized membrane protein